MLNISLEKNANLYQSWSQCLVFLSQSFDYIHYPATTTNFHVYSEIRTPKELLCIKSYLATQNLEKTRLILWSDYDIADNPLISPYKSLIDLRVYTDDVAKDTLLEGSEWLREHDTKYYMRSGIVRFLVTNKFGGIWADMDMVFLRDFRPILDQEWAYMWGSELNFAGHGPCAAMMSFKQNSVLSNLCLSKILETKPVPDSTVLDHILLAKVYREMPFTVFPSVFFNPEWQMNVEYRDGERWYDPNGIGTQTESGWFTKNDYSQRLFAGTFAWHWHNSTYKNHAIEPGSKFDLLDKLTDQRLKERGIL